jgi:hypothetical protein
MNTQAHAANMQGLSVDKVRLTITGVQTKAIMRNLSQAGCMLECSEVEVEIGQFCEIDLRPEFPASGRIAWALGNALGISFHQPVPIGIVRDYALDDWALRRMEGEAPSQNGALNKSGSVNIGN